MSKELYKNIKEKIKKNGKIKVLLFDTETTGLNNPEITQFGYIIKEISINKETNEFIYKNIEEKENYFKVNKTIEPSAAKVTYIIREKEKNNRNYMNEIIKVFKEQNKKINENFIIENFYFLKDTLPFFSKEYFEKIIKENNIELYVGHNLYQYDYIEVLKNMYDIKINPLDIFDTLLIDIYNKKVKTHQGRKLSNEVKKIIKKVDITNKEEIEKQITSRDEVFHSALLDIKVNDILFEYQLSKLKKEQEKEANKEEEIILNNTKVYDKNDILYIKTNMSNNNILTEKQIHNFVEEKEIKTIILVDQQWTKYINLIKKYQNTDIKLIIGINLYNEDNNQYYDVLIKDTLNYRLLLPLLKNANITTNQRLEDINKYTKNLIIPSKKMSTPKYYKKEDYINYFLSNKILNNEAYTNQELEILKNKNIKDESLITGLFTSEIKQEWLNEKIKDFKTVDLAFYSKLELSAFPSMQILHPKIKKEPSTIDEAIVMLENFYQEQYKLRKIDKIIQKSGIDKEKYEERKNKELAILKKIGKIDFIKYFFLVYKIGNIMEGNLDNDLLDENNQNFKIIREAFGYGRGSAPGSLIAFVTGTTGLDPLKYELLFERFIDPSRPDYPDIDIDIVNKEYAFNILSKYFNTYTPKSIDFNKKPYDIYDKYIIEKYIKPNKNFIGKIKTVAYLTPKVIITSLLRLNQFPYFTQSIISKEFDRLVKENGGKDDNIELNEVIEQSEIKNDIIKKADINIFKNANQLKHIYKSSGIHAGGVLFYPFHPEVILPCKDNISEFDKRDLEDLLQIKMDLLGLKTREAIEEIKLLLIKSGKENIIYKHNFDEMNKPEVYKAFYNKYTSQTFQMGSAGMDNLLYRLSPLKFEDIIAITALFRPGPLGSGAVDDYVSSAIKEKRKKYNINFIPLKKWNKIDEEEQNILLEKYTKNIIKDYDKKLINNQMIINIITNEDYFHSTKFNTQVENRFKFDDSELTKEIKNQIKLEKKELNEENFKEKIIELEQKIKSIPSYREITEDTYYTMVYQEQIMHISVQLANYTVLGSNKLRKAIAKQNKEAMDIEKIKFIKGLTQDGEANTIINQVIVNNDIYINKTKTNEIEIITEEQTYNFPAFLNYKGIIEENEYTPNELKDFIYELNKKTEDGESKIIKRNVVFSKLEANFFWDKIEKFGAYAFNKSHAASYSVFTYETQYYKEFAPIITYGTYLKHVPEKHKMQLIKEIKNRNINLELQSLNNIDTNFSIDIEKNAIQLPLTYIKGIGDKEILPFIELFKDYKINTLEEMLILAGAKPRKKITERLGQLGVFEKTSPDFSYISAKEWYHLSGENDDQDNKGFLHSIIEKAIKNAEVQKAYKQTILKYKKENKNKDNILENIWTNNKLLELIQTIKIMSDSFSDKEEHDNKKTLKFYEDIKKAQEILNVEIEKFIKVKSNKEIEKELLLKNIKDQNYYFYKEEKYKEEYEKYKLFIKEELKDVIKLAREKVIENYNNLDIKELMKQKNITEDLRLLNNAEQSDINDKLLKEGNFDNNIDFNYEAIENSDFFGKVETKLNQYGDYYNQFRKEQQLNKFNVIYLTEFLPKVAKEGYETMHQKYGSKTKQYFEDLYKELGDNKDQIQINWLSYHIMTEPQYKEKYEDGYIEEIELENYFADRYNQIFLKIADSKIENIILATPPRSKLLDNIKKYKFKGFTPIIGDKAIVYLKNSKGEKVKKIFAFAPNIFPYKDLNEEKYKMDMEILKKILIN